MREEDPMLVLVVGPSGAGKDTLLAEARQRLTGEPRIRFVRRSITRPADAGGEDHEAVTDAEFSTRDFALQWRAHNLRYGIPADISRDLALGFTVVANVSRSVILAAAARFPVRVIEVTAPPEMLAARLATRGRESASDIAARLSRSAPPLPKGGPEGVEIATVWNDGTLNEGAERFIQALCGPSYTLFTPESGNPLDL